MNSLHIYKVFILMIFLLFLLAGISYSLQSIENGAQKVPDSEQHTLLAKLYELQSRVTTFTADFRQEKELSILRDKKVIEGTVVLKRPNLLRWVSLKPEKTIIVVDGKRMMTYTPKSRKREFFILSESYRAGKFMDFLTGALFGSMNKIEKNFQIRLYRNQDEILYELTPVSPNVANYLKSIVIHYNESSGLPSGFSIFSPKGDKTITEFSGIHINQEVNPELFKIPTPPQIQRNPKVE